MASAQDVPVTLGDHAISEHDASLGSALERVFELQQELVVRRADLLLEKLVAQTWSLASGALLAVLGSAFALIGWGIAMVGVVDAFDGYVARFAVELAVGAINIAAGIAIIFWRRRRSSEDS